MDPGVVALMRPADEDDLILAARRSKLMTRLHQSEPLRLCPRRPPAPLLGGGGQFYWRSLNTDQYQTPLIKHISQN